MALLASPKLALKRGALLTAALGVAVLLGPLADWRTLVRTTRGFLAVSALMAAAAVGAGAMAARSLAVAAPAWAPEGRFAVAALVAFALAAILGEEGRDLLEEFPAARRLLPRLIDRRLRQVEGEAAHHPAGAVVEFDRRGEPARGERRARPDEERGVGRHEAARRRRRGADEIRQVGRAIEFGERRAQRALQILTLVGDLAGDVARDGVLAAAGRRHRQRWIGGQRRHGERGENHHETRRLRAASQRAECTIEGGNEREHAGHEAEAHGHRRPGGTGPGGDHGAQGGREQPGHGEASRSRTRHGGGGADEAHEHERGSRVQEDEPGGGREADRLEGRQREPCGLTDVDREHRREQRVMPQGECPEQAAGQDMREQARRLADDECVALLHARHDATGQQADDLAVDGGASVVVHPDLRLLVHRATFGLVRRQELSRFVRDAGDAAGDGRPVHVHIERREEDRDLCPGTRRRALAGGPDRHDQAVGRRDDCLLYTSPSPRD